MVKRSKERIKTQFRIKKMTYNYIVKKLKDFLKCFKGEVI